MERTLILIKPEGVKRGLSGEIIRRFEQAGLKVVALRMISATKDQVSRHYPDDKVWLESVGLKSIKSYEAKGIKVKETALEIGNRIRNGLMDALTSGPIVAIVLEGNEAIACGRKICGATAPAAADAGTIRGMYSTDSYALADERKRPIRSIIHASDGLEVANREISIWFGKGEISAYKRADEDLVY